MGRLRIFWEFLRFLAENRKWWLVPMISVLALLGLLVVLTQSSSVTPFIYTLF